MTSYELQELYRKGAETLEVAERIGHEGASAAAQLFLLAVGAEVTQAMMNEAAVEASAGRLVNEIQSFLEGESR